MSYSGASLQTDDGNTALREVVEWELGATGPRRAGQDSVG